MRFLASLLTLFFTSHAVMAGSHLEEGAGTSTSVNPRTARDIPSEMGFKADPTKERQIGFAILKEGTVAGRRALFFKGAVEIMVLDLGVAKTWDEADDKCAKAIPVGRWVLPTAHEHSLLATPLDIAPVYSGYGEFTSAPMWIRSDSERGPNDFRGKAVFHWLRAALADGSLIDYNEALNLMRSKLARLEAHGSAHEREEIPYLRQHLKKLEKGVPSFCVYDPRH